MTFYEYVAFEDNYQKLLDKLLKDKNYLYYREITHNEIIELVKEPISPPRRLSIPKDDGVSFRTIYSYLWRDNIKLKFLNEYLYSEFGHLISDRVFSYKSGVSVGDAIRDVFTNYNSERYLVKLDLKDYFTSIGLDLLKPLLDKVQVPVEMQENIFNNKFVDKEFVEYEGCLGMIQGNPISAFISNAFLYTFDNLMSEKYEYYIRYSDDLLIEVPENITPEILLDTVSEILKSDFNLCVNPKKVEIIEPHSTFKFLGCNISPKAVTLSKAKEDALFEKIKKKADMCSKLKVDNETKVKRFINEVYISTLFCKISDISKSSLMYFAFDNVTDVEYFQKFDYLILDKCKYLMTGKNNKNVALKQGYNTEFFECLGFVSLCKFYKLYKRSNKLDFYGEVITKHWDMKANVFKDVEESDEPREVKLSSLLDKILDDHISVCPSKGVYLRYKSIFDVNKDTLVVDVKLDNRSMEDLVETNKLISLARYNSLKDRSYVRYAMSSFMMFHTPRKLLGYYSSTESSFKHLLNVQMLMYMLISLGVLEMPEDICRTENYFGYISEDCIIAVPILNK